MKKVNGPLGRATAEGAGSFRVNVDEGPRARADQVPAAALVEALRPQPMSEHLFFARSDLVGLEHRNDEDPPVADLASASGFGNRLDGLFDD